MKPLKPSSFIYRTAQASDSKKLSILFKQVYIQTYGIEGVSDEFANFITKQFSVERIEDLIHQEQDNLLVAEYKQNLVGVLELAYNKSCPVDALVGPELNKLYILEWFCHQGIGEHLLLKAEDILKKRGEKLCWLWVLESNARAIRFYLKHGYSLIGHADFQMETNKYRNQVLLKYL